MTGSTMPGRDGRPRLLYVTAGFPFPLSSGYLRHHHLLRQLSAGYRLHLASLVGPRFEDGHVEGVAPFVDQVETFRRPTRNRGHKIVQLLDPARADAGTRALAEVVDRAIRAEALDAVVLTGKETAGLVDVIAGRVPLVADLCDATSARISQEIAMAGPVRGAGLRIRRRGMRRIELQLIDRADALTVASERDRTTLHEEGAPDRVLDARVIPNGIDLDHWRRTSDRLGEAVVFCGNLGYGPNADAARHLVLDVMPLVWARRPDLEVVIVGLGASSTLIDALSGPRVTLTGAVDDVRPHLERGAVFAAPLRIATGIQNKLLEAMALEIPVVTTPIGAAGLAVDGVPPVAVADTTEQFAAAIVGATGTPGGTPDRDGRQWVADRFDWAASGRALTAAIDAARNQELSPC